MKYSYRLPLSKEATFLSYRETATAPLGYFGDFERRMKSNGMNALGMNVFELLWSAQQHNFNGDSLLLLCARKRRRGPSRGAHSKRRFDVNGGGAPEVCVERKGHLVRAVDSM